MCWYLVLQEEERKNGAEAEMIMALSGYFDNMASPCAWVIEIELTFLKQNSLLVMTWALLIAKSSRICKTLGIDILCFNFVPFHL